MTPLAPSSSNESAEKLKPAVLYLEGTKYPTKINFDNTAGGYCIAHIRTQFVPKEELSDNDRFVHNRAYVDSLPAGTKLPRIEKIEVPQVPVKRFGIEEMATPIAYNPPTHQMTVEVAGRGSGRLHTLHRKEAEKALAKMGFDLRIVSEYPEAQQALLKDVTMGERYEALLALVQNNLVVIPKAIRTGIGNLLRFGGSEDSSEKEAPVSLAVEEE